MMKLTAGLARVEDWAAFRAAGADEAFVGYVPLAWQQKFGPASPLNRREVVCCDAQLGLKNELERLHDTGCRAAITINAPFYQPDEYGAACEVIEDCLETGFDSFIIADPALIVYLNDTGLINSIRLHVSGEAGEMNRFILEEYKRLGARRIIFNRKVTLNEMARLTGDGLEYEAFFMNERCQFSGALCRSLHCDEMPPICREPYAFDGYVREDAGGIDGCGLCAVPELERAGVTHLKIVGRGARTDDMIKSIRLARMALELWETEKDPEAYQAKLKAALPAGVCGGKCYYYL